MYSVLIADDELYWRSILKSAFKNDELFHVIGTAENGNQAIKLIDELRPDVLLLDIMMPESDGIAVVNYARTKIENYNPYIYILSGMYTHTTVEILRGYDFDYFTVKPSSPQTVIEILHKIVNANPRGGEKRPEDVIAETLYQLGLSLNRRSTSQLSDAILIYISKDNHLLGSELYSETAIKNGVTAQAVEKSIRSLLKKVKQEKTPLYNTIFQADRKVKNIDFVAGIAFYVKEKLSL